MAELVTILGALLASVFGLNLQAIFYYGTIAFQT